MILVTPKPDGTTVLTLEAFELQYGDAFIGTEVTVLSDRNPHRYLPACVTEVDREHGLVTLALDRAILRD